jgi:ribokinase
VVVGSINMDLVLRVPRLPARGETIIGHDAQEIPGGKGANQAVAARRLGARVAMVGRVGSDAFGRRLRSELEQEGIDVRHVLAANDCSSGLALVTVEKSGENAIVVVPGANGRLAPADIAAAEDVFCDADVLLAQLEVPLATVVAALELAKRYGVLTILNPAPAPATFPAELLHVDVICPNESEAAALTKTPIKDVAGTDEAASRLLALGPRHAIITLGARGAVWAGREQGCKHYAALDITAVDTTAAGDAFAAALAVALAGGRGHDQAMQFASAAGALAASRPGAQPALPRRDEVLQLLTRPPHCQ